MMRKTILSVVTIVALSALVATQARAATSAQEKEFEKKLSEACKGLSEKQKQVVSDIKTAMDALLARYKAGQLTTEAYLASRSTSMTDGLVKISILRRSYFKYANALTEEYFSKYGAFPAGEYGNGKAVDKYGAAADSATEKANDQAFSAYAGTLSVKHTETPVAAASTETVVADAAYWWKEVHAWKGFGSFDPSLTQSVTATAQIGVANISDGTSSSASPLNNYNDTTYAYGTTETGFTPTVTVDNSPLTCVTQTVICVGVDGVTYNTIGWTASSPSATNKIGNHELVVTTPNGETLTSGYGFTSNVGVDKTAKAAINTATKELKTSLMSSEKMFSEMSKGAQTDLKAAVKQAMSQTLPLDQFLARIADALVNYDIDLNMTGFYYAVSCEMMASDILTNYLSAIGPSRDFIADGKGIVGNANRKLAKLIANGLKEKRNVAKQAVKKAQTLAVTTAAARAAKADNPVSFAVYSLGGYKALPTISSALSRELVMPKELWVSSAIGYTTDTNDLLVTGGSALSGALTVKLLTVTGESAGVITISEPEDESFSVVFSGLKPGAYTIELEQTGMTAGPYSCSVVGSALTP